jgi:protein-S-isoprenylcysteine O-methyltransferase Ste14
MFENFEFDLTRSIFVCLVQFCIIIVQTSPNSANELGSAQGDKKEKGGEKVSTFRRIFLNVIYCVLTVYHMGFYGQLPVRYDDIFLIVLMIIATVLRIWSYISLGPFFTFNLGIRENHKLIKSGPYKYLIHPSYTGQLVTLYSAVIFFKINIIILVILFLYSIYELHRRISIEEIMMEREFKEEYIQYKLKRNKLLPFIY